VRREYLPLLLFSPTKPDAASAPGGTLYGIGGLCRRKGRRSEGDHVARASPPSASESGKRWHDVIEAFPLRPLSVSAPQVLLRRNAIVRQKPQVPLNRPMEKKGTIPRGYRLLARYGRACAAQVVVFVTATWWILVRRGQGRRRPLTCTSAAWQVRLTPCPRRPVLGEGGRREGEEGRWLIGGGGGAEEASRAERSERVAWTEEGSAARPWEEEKEERRWHRARETGRVCASHARDDHRTGGTERREESGEERRWRTNGSSTARKPSRRRESYSEALREEVRSEARRSASRRSACARCVSATPPSPLPPSSDGAEDGGGGIPPAAAASLSTKSPTSKRARRE
jgi:hypothetical protein